MTEAEVIEAKDRQIEQQAEQIKALWVQGHQDRKRIKAQQSLIDGRLKGLEKRMDALEDPAHWAHKVFKG